MPIDINFDFRTDAGGKDPDSHSPTLRTYHQLLWSKPLPNGEMFELSVSTPGAYLYHRSHLGEFVLTSDSAIPDYRNWKRLQAVITQVPAAEIDSFITSTYTIGGMMVFPGNQIDGQPTINGAKGFQPAIADRLDLTLECIRLHYLGLESPLASTLSRYADFFALFGDFRGYVGFFLLEDLVTAADEVRYFLEFHDFGSPALPQDVDAYQDYRRRSLEFIAARNAGIRQLGI